jgi:23S rRNA (guanosine2251-2'-O)-methyltransferase
MHKVCLVAVDVRSTHNVGSFFRTCDGLGAVLYLVGITPQPLHDDDDRLPHIARKADKDIAKTALGAEKTVKWRHHDTLLAAKYDLEKEGYTLVGLEQSTTSKNLKDLKSDKSIAIVVGREVEGLSLVEQKLCDELYEIPMQGGKESFNVSVAAGMALYQLS